MSLGSGSAAVEAAPKNAAAVLGGMIDAVVQTGDILSNNNLQNVLQNANIQVVYLNKVLNGADIHVLSDILTNSDVLSHNRDVLSNILNDSLNNNDVLKNLLNNNHINVNAAVPIAVNVLSAPITLFFFQPQH